MVLGIFLVFRPIAVVLDFLPFLGNIAGAGIGISSFILGTVLSLSVVSVAWFSYRPALSVCLLTACVLLVFLASKRKKWRSPATPFR